MNMNIKSVLVRDSQNWYGISIGEYRKAEDKAKSVSAFAVSRAVLFNGFVQDADMTVEQ